MESKRKDNRKSVTLYLKILTCLTLVLAFFPMCLVSCSGETAKVTMEQVIVGYEYKGSQVADPAPVYLLYFIFLIVLVIVLFVKRLSYTEKAITTLGCSSACIVLIVVFVSQVEKWSERNALSVQTTGAYVISLCSMVCMDLLAIVLLILRKNNRVERLGYYGTQPMHVNMPYTDVSLGAELSARAKRNMDELKQRTTAVREAWHNDNSGSQKKVVHNLSCENKERKAEVKNVKIQYDPEPFDELFSGIFDVQKTAVRDRNTPPPVPETLYNVAVNGKSTGPYSIEKLSSMAQAGKINLGTLVWKVGMHNWETIDEIPELISVKKHIPPAIKKRRNISFMEDTTDIEDYSFS